MKKFYDCYSFNMMQFFLKNGVVPEKVTQNPVTKRTVWVFRMTDKLDRLLTEWTNGEPIKK